MKTIVKPIEMKSVTDVNGTIKPLRFRITDQEERLHIVNVLTIYSIEQTKIAGEKKRIYTCEIQIRDIVRMCKLRYNLAIIKVKSEYLIFKLFSKCTTWFFYTKTSISTCDSRRFYVR